MVDLKYRVDSKYLEPESREIVVPSERKQLWAVLLDLLLEFKSVCEKHGIRWSIDGGTMLGAKRHGGFIPWDDDVDVIMLRSEYEKLKKVANQEFRHPYFFQNNDTDPDCVRGHAQLRNSDTTAMLKFETENGRARYNFNQGVFIDIFILDNYPDSETERIEFSKRLYKLKLRMENARYYLNCRLSLRNVFSPRCWNTILMKGVFSFQRWFNRDLIWSLGDRLDREAQIYNGIDTANVSHLTFQPKPSAKVVFDRALFDLVELVPFENVFLPCLTRSDEYLTQLYGNWHEQVVGNNCHGGLIVDLNTGYKRYLR